MRSPTRWEALVGSLLVIAVALAAVQNPQAAEIIFMLGSLAGVEVAPPAGFISDYGGLAQQGGLYRHLGVFGITAAATLSILKMLEKAKVKLVN